MIRNRMILLLLILVTLIFNLSLSLTVDNKICSADASSIILNTYKDVVTPQLNNVVTPQLNNVLTVDIPNSTSTPAVSKDKKLNLIDQCPN
jgi:hypothetical protein